MAYPSPSSLSPSSTLEDIDLGDEQLVQLPRHRPCPTSINTLPEPKRSRTTPPQPTTEPTPLQAWLNSISTSPLAPSTHSHSYPHLHLDHIELPGPVDHQTSHSNLDRVGSVTIDAVKNTSLSSSFEISHPTPATTPHHSVASSAGHDVLDTRKATSTEQPHSSFVPRDSSTKDRFVAGLVGASVLAIESIWGPVNQDQCTLPAESKVLPLHWFVKEVLRRSRTSCSTLQLALYYLHKSRREIRDTVARAHATRAEIARLEHKSQAQREAIARGFSYPSPPLSPTAHEDELMALGHDGSAMATGRKSDAQRLAALVGIQQSPVLCGRRMFLAALIGASKFLQDRNYSNRAWARISGLPVAEINLNERAFLGMMKWDLHLGAHDFQKWTARLATLTNQGAALETAAEATHVGTGLARSQSEYPTTEQPTEELMRPVGVLASDAVLGSRVSLGRSRSDPMSALNTAVISAKSRRPVSVIHQIASPPETEVDSASSSEADDEAVAIKRAVPMADSTAPLSSSLRKVRNLPLRRGVALSRQRTGAVGLPRNVSASMSSSSSSLSRITLMQTE